MDFLCNPGIPYTCPDCLGLGRKPYPGDRCYRCGGTGYLVKVLLTYYEEYNTVGMGMGRQMFGGYIERPHERIS